MSRLPPPELRRLAEAERYLIGTQTLAKTLKVNTETKEEFTLYDREWLKIIRVRV